jgi:hypothetical protein
MLREAAQHQLPQEASDSQQGEETQSDHSFLSLLDLDDQHLNWFEDPKYLFALERGFLFLPDSLKEKHNIRKINVTLSTDDKCLGSRYCSYIYIQRYSIKVSIVWL